MIYLLNIIKKNIYISDGKIEDYQTHIPYSPWSCPTQFMTATSFGKISIHKFMSGKIVFKKIVKYPDISFIDSIILKNIRHELGLPLNLIFIKDMT